jgi:hypothetical protein
MFTNPAWLRAIVASWQVFSRHGDSGTLHSAALIRSTVRHFPIALWAPDGGPNVEPDCPKSPPDVGCSTSGLGPARSSCCQGWEPRV